MHLQVTFYQLGNLKKNYSLASHLECAHLIFNTICGKRLTFEGMTRKFTILIPFYYQIV
jgi:hypothetical protein